MVIDPRTGQPIGASGSDPLTSQQQGVYDYLRQVFAGYGLEALAPDILKMVQQGYDGSTITYLLRQTDSYKQRFAGNEIRVKNGYAALEPSEYLQLEQAYKNAAQAYNLPATFYDNPGDFADLIGKDISGKEFADRAAHAFKYAQASSPATKSLLFEYYGITDSQITAYFLDPTKAQAIIDRQAAAIDIGAEAARQGLVESRARAENFADLGVGADRAAAGYAQAAYAQQSGQLDIAKRFGEDLTTEDLSDEFVGGLASARRKRERVNEQEANLFRQNEGVAERGFAQESLGSY